MDNQYVSGVWIHIDWALLASGLVFIMAPFVVAQLLSIYVTWKRLMVLRRSIRKPRE